ncbi:hypothetical protein BDV29DRAFT_182974 [Aspergillus leporis]|jgi:hypothetical protein|uniref:Uncharacterized protein n=1 Tax=Aspergillus leporis TaxID=41062 RepID=A0A5N5WQA5_9EURO|nr:hypothetical protein BDV29DRAFT_182974 [Aspergillus leporis]
METDKQCGLKYQESVRYPRLPRNQSRPFSPIINLLAFEKKPGKVGSYRQEELTYVQGGEGRVFASPSIGKRNGMSSPIIPGWGEGAEKRKCSRNALGSSLFFVPKKQDHRYAPRDPLGSRNMEQRELVIVVRGTWIDFLVTSQRLSTYQSRATVYLCMARKVQKVKRARAVCWSASLLLTLNGFNTCTPWV